MAVGVLAAALPSPFIVAAGLVGLAVGGAIIARPVLGLFVLLAVVAVLPFGVLPVRMMGVQPTLIDVVLLTTGLGIAVRAWSSAEAGQRLMPPMGAAGWAWAVFVGVAVLAFAVGAAQAGTSAEQARRFAKLIASLLVFPLALALVGRGATLERLARVLMVGGGVAGSIATALWLLPSSTQVALLTALGSVGYPTVDVLRYVPGPNNTYTSQLRATGTAVDPNVLGGTLMLALTLVAMQLVTRDRLLPRPVLVLVGLPALAGMVLSLSRSSWLGFVVGLACVAAVRYRRLLLWIGLGVVLLGVLPVGQGLVTRFVSGFTSADPATALRLGEYRNALLLIQRYPLLGIGFGPSPDSDVTAGVSSMYLLVGEQAGVLGLLAYLTALVLMAIAGFRGLRAARACPDERGYGLLAGLAAGFLAAMVAGAMDHYFANQAFPHAVALFWLYAGLLVVATSRAHSADGRLAHNQVSRQP